VSKRAKLVIFVCAALLGLATIGAVGYMAWPFVSSSDINREIAQLKEQGKPVSSKEIACSRVPDTRNAAVLYEKAIAALPGNREALRSLSDFLQRQGRSDPELAAAARRAVGDYDGVLSLAEQASRRQCCRFSDDSGTGIDPRRPHLAGLRDIARVACARAILRARDGQMALAAQDIRLTIACSDALRGERMLMPFTARVAILRTAAAALEGCIDYDALTTSDCRDIYDSLGRIDLPSDFLRALDGERAYTISYFEESGNDGMSWLFSESPDTAKAPKKKGVSAAVRQFGRAVLRIDERYYLRKMDEQIKIARLPYRDIKRRKLDTDPTADAPRCAVLSTISLPLVQRATPTRDLGMAAVAGCRIALALEAYMCEFGSYPQSLEQLRSRLGWKIELDPFSGRDFIYKRLPRGYLLYSIGPDLKDDGGSPPAHSARRELGRGRIQDARPRSYSVREAWRMPDADVVWRIERSAEL
jgi:hypothetical protein